MAFAIESRSPFLDYRLVEFAFSLPSRFKIRDGLGKWLIREGMAGMLPEEVRTRRDKQGMIAPTEHWFRGENRDEVRELLGSDSLAARGLLDRDEVLRRFDEHVAGHANHYLRDLAVGKPRALDARVLRRPPAAHRRRGGRRRLRPPPCAG